MFTMGFFVLFGLLLMFVGWMTLRKQVPVTGPDRKLEDGWGALIFGLCLIGIGLFLGGLFSQEFFVFRFMQAYQLSR